MVAVKGIAQSRARRDVLGTFHVDARMNLGDELPMSAS